MARNRQRAKERQARRKAERGGDGVQPPEPAAEPDAPPQPEPEPPELSASEELRVGAPPEDLGTSESVLEYEQDLEGQEGDEHFDLAEDHPEEDGIPPARAVSAARTTRRNTRTVAVSYSSSTRSWPSSGACSGRTARPSPPSLA